MGDNSEFNSSYSEVVKLVRYQHSDDLEKLEERRTEEKISYSDAFSVLEKPSHFTEQ